MRSLLFFVALPLFAQQTIFNVPSADIAVKKDWFFQHQTTTRAWNPGDSTLSVGFKTVIPLLRPTSRMPLRLVIGDMFEFTERPFDGARRRSPHEGN